MFHYCSLKTSFLILMDFILAPWFLMCLAWLVDWLLIPKFLIHMHISFYQLTIVFNVDNSSTCESWCYHMGRYIYDIRSNIFWNYKLPLKINIINKAYIQITYTSPISRNKPFFSDIMNARTENISRDRTMKTPRKSLESFTWQEYAIISWIYWETKLIYGAIRTAIMEAVLQKVTTRLLCTPDLKEYRC